MNCSGSLQSSPYGQASPKNYGARQLLPRSFRLVCLMIINFSFPARLPLTLWMILFFISASSQTGKTDSAVQREKQKATQIKTLSAGKIKNPGNNTQLYEQKIKAQNDEIVRRQTETQSQARENELLKKEMELQDAKMNRQKFIITAGIVFLVLGGGFTFFVLIEYRNKKKSNDLLKKKNEIIYQQKEQIEQKNTLITDSIDYAKNIQDAILPHEDLLRKHFPLSFILHKPKDIVSGDFYWMHEETSNDCCFYIASADCTGHGVPGAFMSLLGFIMLDTIVKNIHTAPAQILKEVNTQLMDMLHQDDENTTGKFGMDIALMKYDRQKKEIIYSGAHNPLIILNNGQITEVKADKFSIGTMSNCSFSNNTVRVKNGDTIYLYTDGYQDQIGGAKRKKFLSYHLKELLQQIHTFDPEIQKDMLDKKHLEWRGATEQTDDILIIGLKI